MDMVSALQEIADRGNRELAEQWNPEDDIVDGVAICDVCGKPKETIVTVKLPDGSEKHIKAQCLCGCGVKLREQQREEEKRKDRQIAVETLKSLSLMTPELKKAKFESFKETADNAKNLKICRRYAEAFSSMYEKQQGLLMYGNVGTGKTFSAACIANYLMEHGRSVVMTSLVKLLNDARDGNGDMRLNQLNRADLIILDDLGTERDTEFGMETVYKIIDSRYRSGKPMVLTTNLQLRDMMEEEDIRRKRIYDRILEKCYPMEYKGKSWRGKAANQRFKQMEQLLAGD